MKIRIEVENGLTEDEVIIRCARVTEQVRRIERFAAEQDDLQLIYYDGEREYYFPAEDVLFFETEGDKVYAHTEKDSYLVKYRLYELEGALPPQFVRVSKSTILNAGKVHAISRNLASSSKVEFSGSHKSVYVSRRYFAPLKYALQQRR